MSNNNIQIDSVPEPTQAIVLEAKTDLVNRLGVDAEIVSVTKLERLERLDPDEATPSYGFGAASKPDYRIFLLVKGTQYIYETRRGKTPTLVEEKFVV